MSYEFKKLSEVEALTEVPEGATVLAEVGGAIKRIPGEGLGGGGGLLITLDMTGDEETLKANSTANMTLSEAIAACQKGVLGTPIFAIANPDYGGAVMYTPSRGYMDCTSLLGSECLQLSTSEFMYSMYRFDSIFWTAAGFTTEQPSV